MAGLARFSQAESTAASTACGTEERKTRMGREEEEEEEELRAQEKPPKKYRVGEIEREGGTSYWEFCHRLETRTQRGSVR